MDDLSIIADTQDISESQIHENLEQLAKLRDHFEDLTLVDTAAFYTDKLITCAKDGSASSKREAYRMAKLLHEKGEFHRAAHFIIMRGIHHSDISCRYLAAKCYYDCHEYSKAMETLTLAVPDMISFDDTHGTMTEWQSSIELLKGLTHEALGDRDFAKKCFLQALRLNLFCYEAFQAFTRFDMVSKDEEKELLSILEFDKEKFSTTADHFFKYFYMSELNKRGDFNDLLKDAESILSASTNSESTFFPDITASIDLRLNEAEQLYNDCKFKQCFKIVSEVNNEDLYNPRCLLLKIGCFMELNKEIGLQEIAHKLVEIYPENPISWYAVGCYYYMVSNADTARKHFSKAALIDPTFQPAMLMYGHCFEMESLHDQAMAVYLDLSKAMSASFLPLLYVGVEYLHLNNVIMAERYIRQALDLSPNRDNLFVIHELAIVCYQKKDYESALTHFGSVYEILLKKHLLPQFPEKWEPLLNNMGHVCRKLGRYDQAITFHKQALRMIAQNASTYDSIGLVYSLKGELQMACDFFQKALSLKRDDAFAMTMYTIVENSI